MRRNNRLVYGMGINDSDYPVYEREGGKIIRTCPYYRKWKDMLKRAYCSKYQKIQPTYQGVTVCEEWRSFMNFRAWMLEQDWEDKHLDKDILFQGNKVYSPDTCVFIDGIANTFMNDSGAIRGQWPLGVSWFEPRQKFRGLCRNPFNKKQEYLGLFTCPQEAHHVWKNRKRELAFQIADLQTDQRVADALRQRYNLV